MGASLIARWLEAHPAVKRVYYPGLDSFPQKALTEKQQRAPDAMISFKIKAGAEVSIQALNHVKLCSCAESLGGLKTFITHPSSTTHADLDPEYRRRLSISDGLIRLSVGPESPEDIIADLEQAFAATGCVCATEKTCGVTG
jgi:cystathionine gamma-lyase